MEAAIKRILPHSTEAEQAVVGAMLMDKDAIMVAAEMLTGEDFYQSAYGMLFDAMVELFQAGKPVDLITLQEHLKEKNAPPEISGLEFARELLVNAQTSANIKYYAEIVREKATLRKMIKINEEIANNCYLENQPLDVIMDAAEKRIFELAQHGNSQEYTPIKQVVLNALEVIEKASKTKGHGDTTFIPWTSAYISGLSTDEYYEEMKAYGKEIEPLDKEAMLEYVQKSGGQVIAKKGATFYAVSELFVSWLV